MNQIEVTGMILVAGGIGEYDRRVEILTRERGRISAFAKGARRPNSSLVSATNPFVFGTFVLYQGRNSYTLNQAKVENYFAELRTNIDGAFLGFYFLELASYYSREGNDETEMLKLLYQTLRVLVKNEIPYELVRRVFELKVMTIQGEGPQVFQCVNCGKNNYEDMEKNTCFMPSRGGIICKVCLEKERFLGNKLSWHASTIYTMQYVVSSEIGNLYTFAVSDEVLEDLKRIMKQYMEFHVDKSFHSLNMLEGV